MAWRKVGSGRMTWRLRLRTVLAESVASVGVLLVAFLAPYSPFEALALVSLALSLSPLFPLLPHLHYHMPFYTHTEKLLIECVTLELITMYL